MSDAPSAPQASCWPLAVLVFAVALLARAPFLTSPGFAVDQSQFIVWSEKGRSSGLASVYEERSAESGRRGCNYPPAYLYVLRLLASVYDGLSPAGETLDADVAGAVLWGQSTPSARRAIWLYKMPAVMADALLGFLIVLWLGPRIGRRWAALIGVATVCMPVVVHNSTVWGQVDAIPTLLVVASLEMGRRRRLYAMTALATLAVLTKAQAGMMLPIWGVIALQGAGRDWRRWLGLAGTMLGVGFVILMPFRDSLTGGVWDAYAKAARFYPYTHLNGYSIWFLGNPLTTPHLGGSLPQWYLRDDVPGWMGVTPRSWGLVGLLGVWVCATAVMWRRRADEKALFWTARLLPLAFFVLSTQMHERYLFPAIAVWAWSCIPSRRWCVCWAALGVCATINALWVWVGPGDGPCVTACRQVLHRPWLGLVPGIWCSLVLAWLFAAVFVGWLDGVGMLSKRASAGTPPVSR